MALQDLTPQLRTRLNRMERAVGAFVLVAAVLLLVGFGYYLRQTAIRKGWFLKKITYQTCVASASGLKVGNPVKMMGFDVGEITAIIPNDPYDFYNITIRFEVKLDQYNYPGYIWSDSKAKVNAGDLLGGRFLEITKGKGGLPTVRPNTNTTEVQVLRNSFVEQLRKERFDQLQTVEVTKPNPRTADDLNAQVWAELKVKLDEFPDAYYTNRSAANIYLLMPLESPSVTEQLQGLVDQVERALPGILELTNKVNAVLANSAALASNLNAVALNAQPAVTNFAALAAELRGPGALGQWALGTNGQQSLDATLANANLLLAHSDTNLIALMESFGESLENLAGITSNLNAQVQANTNILSSVSQAVVNTDELVQGLKRHWLLRSAFKKKPAPTRK